VSSYHLNQFLFDIKMNESTYQEALVDLKKAVSRYDLTSEEKDALTAGDPRRLRQLGAHGMLSLYIMRLNPDFRTNIYWTQK
jgi:hypothetical protein